MLSTIILALIAILFVSASGAEVQTKDINVSMKKSIPESISNVIDAAVHSKRKRKKRRKYCKFYYYKTFRYCKYFFYKKYGKCKKYAYYRAKVYAYYYCY